MSKVLKLKKLRSLLKMKIIGRKTLKYYVRKHGETEFADPEIWDYAWKYMNKISDEIDDLKVKIYNIERA